MQMTDTEILGRYNRSDDKKDMIMILADLNGCDEDTIKQILIKSGVPESEFITKKRQSRKKKQPVAEKEAPAGKPNPTEAAAVVPKYDDSLPLPFSDDDMGIGDDEYGSGAITGGEGIYNMHEDYGSLSAGGYIPPRKYRSADELLTEPDDMTSEEKERLARIKAIPNVVKDLCMEELRTLHDEIMMLEKKSDIIKDYLNGESE